MFREPLRNIVFPVGSLPIAKTGGKMFKNKISLFNRMKQAATNGIN